MGSRYLTDLATVCRNAGLVVQEEPGWQSRSRGSGGYDSGRPTHVMIHHTASNPSSDGQADVNYCCYGSADKPLANLYLSRTGRVWVMAAGATNTNGKGHDWWGGGVPDDSMNTHAIGIEAANTGTGEAWPQSQQEAYQILVQALQHNYGVATNRVRQHSEWAPDRKIDPAGQSRWGTGASTWHGDAFRADASAGWPDDEPDPPDPPKPKPPPYPEDETVDYLRVNRNASSYVVFRRTGGQLVWLTRAQITAEQTSYTAAGMTAPKETSSNANVTDLLAGYVLVGPVPPEWPPVSAFLGHVEL
jgi:hypothetical protein